jgi:hypothetical protein
LIYTPVQFRSYENTQGVMWGLQSNVVCGVDEVVGVVCSTRCSESCITEVLYSIPTWSTSRRVGSTPSKQQHSCSWWQYRVLFGERDQILCYFTPNITFSFNPKAQPPNITLTATTFLPHPVHCSWDPVPCLPNYTALHCRRLQTWYNLVNFNPQLWSLCILLCFSLKVMCPVHTYNNRTAPTLVFEPEDPVMLKLTLGALCTYAHYVVP